MPATGRTVGTQATNMDQTILDLHHYLAYLVLLLVAGVLSRSFWAWRKGLNFTAQDNKTGFLVILATHTQFMLGLISYFVSPMTQQAFDDFGLVMTEPTLRLFALEHPLVMLIAVVLITVARIKTKRTDANAAHKTNFILYAIALLLILSRIPWDKWLGLS